MTPLEALVACSREVAGTRARGAKIASLAAFLGRLSPEEARVGAAYAAGELPQGKVGVGHRTVHELDAGAPPTEPILTLTEVDRAIDALARARGAEKKRQLGALMARATAAERELLAGLLVSNVRQGALLGLVLEAAALARGVPGATLRRAAMLAGSEVEAIAALLAEGARGLERFVLRPFSPILPMLASPADDAEAAIAALGRARLEVKLDGARIQAHKDGDEVRFYSRSLHDVSARVPELVELVRAMPHRRLILDGEAIALDADGRPRSFQTTMRRFGRTLEVERMRAELPLTGLYFDLLLVDDDVLLDAPGRERRRALEAFAPRERAIETADPEEVERFYAETLARGHEGLMAKSLDAPYEAGHRGSAWLKLKPAHTLDLVVLAVERGSGRRAPYLSNLHLGARVPGGFAMVGKTFKGMSDATLAWQTRRLRELAVSDDGWVVRVRPELLAEIAVGGVQASSEYESGLSLRFARLERYREDKPAEQASSLEELRALTQPAPRARGSDRGRRSAGEGDAE